MGQMFGDPAHATALEAGGTANHAVQRDRNNGSVHVFHDALESALEGQQLANTSDLAFGKNTDDLAIADGIAGGLQRMNELTRALFGGNGDGAEDFGKRLYATAFVDVFEHQEAYGPVGGSNEQ